ncbi:MAG: hypothetical protein U1E37_13040 [Sphingomonadaceae bacterium]
MTMMPNPRRIAAAGLALLLSLALTACFVMPGKFVATLDLRKDGTFTYTYKGEMLVIGLTKLAQIVMAPKKAAAFEASPCYKKDDVTERACTKDELAQQKTDWDAEQKAKAEKDAADLEVFKKMFGGIDPNDPKAAEELAARMRGQAGWKSVVYKGNGTYEVDVAISGRLDYDMSFPTIERMPGVTAFLVANRRANGEVRIDSPLMQAAALTTPMGNAAQTVMQSKMPGGNLPDFPMADGHFTLTTDAVILANNTEHGPKVVPGGKQLDWDISGHNPIAPYALIGLAK